MTAEQERADVVAWLIRSGDASSKSGKDSGGIIGAALRAAAYSIHGGVHRATHEAPQPSPRMTPGDVLAAWAAADEDNPVVFTFQKHCPVWTNEETDLVHMWAMMIWSLAAFLYEASGHHKYNGIDDHSMHVLQQEAEDLAEVVGDLRRMENPCPCENCAEVRDRKINT